VKDKISPEDKTLLEEKVSSTMSWLDSNVTAEKEEFEEKQKELEAVALPILQKMGGGAAGPGGMPDMSGMPGMGGMGGMPGAGGMGGMPGAGGPTSSEPAGGPTIEEID